MTDPTTLPPTPTADTVRELVDLSRQLTYEARTHAIAALLDALYADVAGLPRGLGPSRSALRALATAAAAVPLCRWPDPGTSPAANPAANS